MLPTFNKFVEDTLCNASAGCYSSPLTMKLRHLLPLIGLLALADFASAQTYTRSEKFAESPSNWRPSRTGQLFGYDNRNFFGGRGCAGGLLQPTTFFNFYGDLFLNGALGRSTPLSASGQILISRTSGTPPYATTAYIAHFAQSANPFVQVLGLALSGAENDSLTACAIIQFADGNAFVGKPVRVRVNPDRILNWSYEWDPTGGPKGAGQLRVSVGSAKTVLALDDRADGSDFALDSFGLFQPSFQQPDSRSFLELFIDDVSYTARVGRAPSLRIRGPRTLRTNDATLTIRGTTKVDLGSRVTRVRYQLIRNGRPTRFRTADGTAQWTLQTQIPRGTSRVKVLARSDDGTATTKTRRIRRQ
jgi:hypothetical protein